MGKSIREVYGTVLAELGDTNENIVVLDADLSGSTKSGIFAKAHPERHFNMGIAESDMVATAAGLATTGKIPFVNTFTVFLTTLGLISARAQVCYGNLNVKFGGAYCGMSDALDGATHHATEDIAVMRALPNMTVLVPSDATSTRWATKYAVDTYGPMYLRLSRDGGIRTDGRRDGQQHRQHGDDGTVGRAAGRRDQQADEKRHQRQEARAQAELHHKPGQALNEAALAQLLRQDAGQQKREDNDTQRVVFQAVHDRLFKFLFVFCQQERHTQSGETCHAEQHQGHFLHRGDHDHEAHEDQQRRTRAERAPVKLHTFVFLHCEVLLSNNPTPVLLYAVFLALLCVKVN